MGARTPRRTDLTKGRVLVTGASGFIGGAVALRLLERGRTVRLLLREGSDAAELLRLGAEEFRGDLTDPGSLEGILALKKGYAHMAGSHLLDPVTGEYNIPYIQKYLTGMGVKIIHLAYRQQGFILPRGNPQRIKGLSDLVQDGIRFINRQRGSGTRVLLDYLIEKDGIEISHINGYKEEEFTHLGVAVAIESGRAGVGLGIYGAAKALDLDFVPLEQERYDLIIPQDFFDNPQVQQVIEVLRSEEFRAQIEGLGGYDPSQMGEEVVI